MIGGRRRPDSRPSRRRCRLASSRVEPLTARDVVRADAGRRGARGRGRRCSAGRLRPTACRCRRRSHDGACGGAGAGRSRLRPGHRRRRRRRPHRRRRPSRCRSRCCRRRPRRRRSHHQTRCRGCASGYGRRGGGAGGRSGRPRRRRQSRRRSQPGRPARSRRARRGQPRERRRHYLWKSTDPVRARALARRPQRSWAVAGPRGRPAWAARPRRPAWRDSLGGAADASRCSRRRRRPAPRWAEPEEPRRAPSAVAPGTAPAVAGTTPRAPTEPVARGRAGRPGGWKHHPGWPRRSPHSGLGHLTRHLVLCWFSSFSSIRTISRQAPGRADPTGVLRAAREHSCSSPWTEPATTAAAAPRFDT